MFARRVAVSASLISAAVLIGPAFAPLHAQSRVQVGVLAGANLATLTDVAGEVTDVSSALDTKYRAGFQGGLFSTIRLRGRLSLQPEVHYAQKGAKFDGAFTGDASGNAGLALKLAYVDIPVLARIEAGNPMGIHPFLVLGPSLSLRTSCTLSVTTDQIDLSTACASTNDGSPSESFDPIRKSAISGVVGVGLAGTMLGRSASVQLRVSQGLRSIAADAPDGSSASVSPKNRGISIMFGLTR
jgi:hypothetical protein